MNARPTSNPEGVSPEVIKKHITCQSKVERVHCYWVESKQRYHAVDAMGAWRERACSGP